MGASMARPRSVLVEELGSPTLEGQDPVAPVAAADELGLDNVSDVSWGDVFGDGQGAPAAARAATTDSPASSSSGDGHSAGGASPSGAGIPEMPHDAQWRTAQQRLTVSLLAQLCANQDSTPRLFIETCVRLYKAGLLDSLDFLSDILARTQARGHGGELDGTEVGAGAGPQSHPPVLRDTRSLVRRAITGGPAGASILFPGRTRLPHRPRGVRPRLGRAGVAPPQLPPGYMASLLRVTQQLVHHEALALGLSTQGSTSPALPWGMVPAVGASRFQSEFEHLGQIGKGAFGRVFHVRHRVDKAEYAVSVRPRCC